MNEITYTFPENFQVKELRNVTATGGKPIQYRGMDVVSFKTKVNGKAIMAKYHDKPELAALVAEYRATQAGELAKRQAEKSAFSQTIEGQRDALVQAERNSYSEEAFPGSPRWMKNKKDRDALEAFDRAHPEIAKAAQAAWEARQKDRYNAMSDFVKMGS